MMGFARAQPILQIQKRAKKMAGPLAGIKVIEVGQALAGPLAGAILSDMGADVIKV